MTSPETGLDHERIAARFERHARLSALAVVPIGLIALADIITGSITNDRRIDIALLAAVVMGLSGAYSLHRLAEGLRRNELRRRPTPFLWIRTGGSLIVSVAFPGAVGYLLGGWPAAIALAVLVAALIGVSIGIGLHKRRRQASQG